MYEDKNLVCVDCKKEFVFTTAEQEFYAQKGFQNQPVRCRPCRDEKKKRFNESRGGRGGGGGYGGGGGGGGGMKQTFKVTCAACGTETEVPFKPTGNRPVYCRACFDAQRGA